MDWREYMRGFFGGRPPGETPRGRDTWPPPPPISGLSEEQHGDMEENRRGLFGGTFPGMEGGRDFEQFGNRFVFGDMFSMMGEMFQEMERSMREVETHIGDFSIEDPHGVMPALPAPQDSQIVPCPPSKENNLRNSVLKEPDSSTDKHIISAPVNPSDKIDRNLDDLYEKSMLDFSDLPVPGTELSRASPSTPTQPRSGFTSSYSRTSQSYSFNNGRWEGVTVKENAEGREVTRIFTDANGQRHETTEFFPSNGPSSSNSVIRPLQSPPGSPSSNRFNIFDFFKPRM